MRAHVTGFAGLVGLLGAGCLEVVHRDFAWATGQPAPTAGMGDCGDAAAPAPASTCDWVTAHDAMFVGEILEVGPSWDPLSIYPGGGAPEVLTDDPTQCTYIRPALRFRVRVKETEWGSVDGDEVTVLIGAFAVEHWNYTQDITYPKRDIEFSQSRGSPECRRKPGLPRLQA